MEANQLDNLGEIIHMLSAKGITKKFGISNECNGLVDHETGKIYSLFELQLLRTYRFKSNSRMNKSGALYLLATYKGLMGYVVDYHFQPDKSQDESIREMVTSVSSSN